MRTLASLGHPIEAGASASGIIQGERALVRTWITVVAVMAASCASSGAKRKSEGSSEAVRLLALAKAERVQGRYADAARHLTGAVESGGPNAELYLERAAIYLELQLWSKAFDDSQRVLALGSSDPLAYSIRAHALWRLGRLNEAAESYSTAIRLRPEDPSPWRDRGVVHLGARRFREAVADFDQVIRLQPNSPEGWRRRGRLSANWATSIEPSLT